MQWLHLASLGSPSLAASKPGGAVQSLKRMAAMRPSQPESQYQRRHSRSTRPGLSGFVINWVLMKNPSYPLLFLVVHQNITVKDANIMSGIINNPGQKVSIEIICFSRRSSCVNPFIFGIFSLEFWRAFRDAFYSWLF